MDPTMCLTYIIISYVTTVTLAYAKDFCTNSITKKLINGYFCSADTKTVQFSYVPLHLCTHYCSSIFQCSMLSYHVNKSLCLLHKDICVEMVPAKQQVFSSTILYRSPINECISWLAYGGSIPDGERLVYMEQYNRHYVGRLHYNYELLPGKLVKGSQRVVLKSVSLVNGLNTISLGHWLWHGISCRQW